MRGEKLVVLFGWAFWLILIALGFMLLSIQFDLWGSEQINLGVRFIRQQIFWLQGRNTNSAARLLPGYNPFAGNGTCLIILMVLLLIPIMATQPRPWLKCPNCKARGWVIADSALQEKPNWLAHFLGRRVEVKRWNRCVRCKHEYGHRMGYESAD